jgi:hypothetical protein
LPFADPFDFLFGLTHPGSHRLFAMIALGKNVCQPEAGNPAPTQAWRQALSAQAMIKNVWQPQADHYLKQERKIINTFSGDGNLSVYPPRLSDNSRSSQNFQRTLRDKAVPALICQMKKALQWVQQSVSGMPAAARVVKLRKK